MNVSVIVITHNNSSIIKECLKSIISQLSDKDQLIILDNGSMDGTYELLQENSDIDILIREEINIGISKGRNKAANFAKNEYLFFVDADMIVHNGSIDSLKKCTSDIVIGIYYNTGEGLVWYRETKSKYLSGKDSVCFSPVTLNNFYTMSGGFSAIKYELFMELNGFDSFFDNATMEDIDFEIRALNKNKTVSITSSISGTHCKNELNKKKFLLWCISCGKGNARLFFKSHNTKIQLPKTKYYPRYPFFSIVNFIGLIGSLVLVILNPCFGIAGIIFSLSLFYFHYIDLFKFLKNKKNILTKHKVMFLLSLDDILTNLSLTIELVRLYIKRRGISNDG